MTIHLIVGTAGHVDHGKTALIKALTGVDADRLPEEKRRGMTVDLGFASLDLEDFRLGIVDVPGHERFIRNMLAGALAVDVAMLVIAASESVKPQTREHLEILKYAGVQHGMVVLTKCDLVDAAWLELVEEEVRELTAGSFLSEAPIIHVSSTKPAGLPELRTALADASRRSAASPRGATFEAPFCLGVDRAFSVAGHGTIVTGSVVSGRLRVGDEVVIAPSGTLSRVRSLQSYNAAVESVQRGQRAAINLAGVPLESIRRGDLLAQPGFLSASRCICARLAFTPQHRSKLGQNLSVRVHLGTAEIHSSLRWLERPRDGEEMIAELRTHQPVACLSGQPVVIRSQCAAMTFGGGRVLDPEFRPGVRWSAADLWQLRQLDSPDLLKRSAAAVFLNGLNGFDEHHVARRVGVEPPPRTLIEPLIHQRTIEPLELDREHYHLLHAQVLENVSKRIERLLDKQHQRNPLKRAIPRSVLQKIFKPVSVPGLLDAVVHRMAEAGRLVSMPAGLALPGYAPQLSKKQRAEYARIIELHRDARLAPPTVDELVANARSHRESVPTLVDLAVAEGHLIRICAEWCLHWETERDLQQTLQASFGQTPFAVSDLRDLLQTTRKYSVPLCEYLDRMGFTQRDGNLRTIVVRDASLRKEYCG